MIVPNPNPNQCDRFHLQRLEWDELTEQQASSLAKHLDQCPHCRKQLDDSLSSDASWDLAKGTVLERLRPETRPFNSDSKSVKTSEIGIVPWLQPWPLTENDSRSQSNRGLSSSGDSRDSKHHDTNPRYIGTLDGYPIVRIVGQGGMGVVLEAWDRELHRPVAIKAMHPHLASIGVSRLRFIREARCAASIVHANVIAIHRIYAEHHPPYFIMPLIAGESLQSRIDREGTIPVDQSMRIIAQVASGLAAAEEQGLVHRDVKPANILVEHGTDRALLTDFGLVRALHEATITMSGSIAGTPQYMSPEQARGESLDTKTDLYSLGAVLYTMLTGHPPFESESPLALVKSIAESSPKPLSYHEPAIPAAVQTFVSWLMERDKTQRPQSASQVAEVAMEIHAYCVDPMHHKVPARILSRQRLASLRSYGQRLMSSVVIGVAVLAIAWMSFPFLAGSQQWPFSLYRPSPTSTTNGNIPENLGIGSTGSGSGSAYGPQPSALQPTPATRSLNIDQELRDLSEKLESLEVESMEEFRASASLYSEPLSNP